MSYYPTPTSSRSPPPLQHPKPTHPHYQIPEPPGTPAAEPQGYMRFTSSPQPNPNHAPSSNNGFYGGDPSQHMGGGGGGAFVPGYQSFGGGPGMGGPMHQQQQQVPMQPGLNPANMMMNMGMGAWGVNDATAQMGMQIGQSAVHAGQEYVQKNLGIYLPMTLLKHQFNVSNSYVLRKLRLVLFPWRHRPWSRKVRRSEVNGQNEGWQPPREDINSPDLYIPVMAFVTYILLVALKAGLTGQFHPEVLGLTASKALGSLVLEFLFIKLGCYFLNIQGQGQVLDIFAYGGYKFVGIIVTVLASMVHLRRTFYWIVFAYAFCANAFFLLRSLRYVVLPDPASSPATVSAANTHTLSHAQRGRRIQFLFLVALSQVCYMGVLVWL